MRTSLPGNDSCGSDWQEQPGFGVSRSSFKGSGTGCRAWGQVQSRRDQSNIEAVAIDSSSKRHNERQEEQTDNERLMAKGQDRMMRSAGAKCNSTDPGLGTVTRFYSCFRLVSQ